MKQTISKRVFSLLLALVLLLTVLPQVIPAASAEDAYSGSCGDDLTWRFDPDTGALTIEGSGAMLYFKPNSPPALYSPWYAFADQIVSVSLPNGLTSIAYNAFLACSALSSVSIPEGVVSLGFSCFEGCGSLRSVTIPEGVEIIYDHTFSGCKSLTELSVPAGVTHVYTKAFANCDALRAVTFLNPMCDIEKDCLDSSGNVTVYGYAGSAAEYLAESQGYPFVSLGNAEYGGACGDDLLWTFDPDARTLSIEGSGDMWLAGSEEAEYREYPWHFAADMITALDLPEGLTTIENQAFQDCSALNSVSIPQTVTAVRSDAFINCTGLTSVELPEGLTYLSGFRNCYSLSGISIPSTVTVLGYNAFTHCGAMTEIELPNGVTSIGDWAFDGCWSLPEITLPDGLTEVDSHAFSGCEVLTEMTFPASVTFVGVFALESCDSLSAVTFLNPTCEIGYKCLGDNTRATIYGYYGSTAEAYAEENGNPFVYLDADDMRGACGDNLSWSFDPVTGVLSIDGSGDMWDFGEIYHVPWYPYSTNLNAVSLPDGLTRIGNYAFESCVGLTELSVPGSVDSIGFNAFSGCSYLESLTLAEGLRVIDEQAFLCCSSLTAVTLPESLEMLGMNAFLYCFNLRQVVVRNPGCEICAAQECGARAVEYDVETKNTLGVPGQTVIYVIHDAEKENTEMFPKTLDTIWGPLVYGFRYPENYAKTYGYTCYALKTFSDVPTGKWYEIPVAWAYGRGITSGTGNGNFSTNQPCTREQIVNFIWKAYGAPEAAGEELPFTDVVAGKYYENAVRWAYHHDPQITGGMNATTFGVGKPCTRAQVVTFLYAAAGKPEPEATENPFTDVKETDYFYKAVLWAVEKGITSGTSPTTFSPKQTCTRAQVVTFLYQKTNFYPHSEG